MALAKTKKRKKSNDSHRILWFQPIVGSLRISVYLVNPAKFRDMRGRVGLFVSDAALILISWDLPHDVAENCALHELTHAAFWAMGMSLKGHRPTTDEEEEAVVNPLSSILYDTLKRNKFLKLPTRPVTPHDQRVVAKAKASKR
jgi:hypothetical protein